MTTDRKITYAAIWWLEPFSAEGPVEPTEALVGLEPVECMALCQVLDEDADTLTVFTTLRTHNGEPLSLGGLRSIPIAAIQRREDLCWIIDDDDIPSDVYKNRIDDIRRN